MKKLKIKKLSFKKTSVMELNLKQMYIIRGGSPVLLDGGNGGSKGGGDGSLSITNTQTNPKSGYSHNCPPPGSMS
jgi:hypothetical protein